MIRSMYSLSTALGPVRHAARGCLRQRCVGRLLWARVRWCEHRRAVYVQVIGVVAGLYAAIASFVLELVDVLLGLRVSTDEETEGQISPSTTSAATPRSRLADGPGRPI